MKKILALAIYFSLLISHNTQAQCTFGNYPPVYTGTNVTFGDNFVHGKKYTLATSGTLTSLGYKGVNPGPKIRMAIYASNGVSPTFLVASTNTAMLQSGNQLLPVITPTVLPAGDYFIFGNYSGSTFGPQVNSSSTSTHVSYYSPQQFTAALTYSPTWQTSTGEDFNYWADLNPIVQISGAYPVCTGASLTLTTSGATTYTWNTLSSNTVVVVTPTPNSTYSVVGTWTNGCYNVATTTITMLPSPTITVNSGTICAGKIFTFQPSGATSYTLSSFSSTVNPQQTTSYTVTGTNTLGCTGSATSTIVVNAPPVLTVNSGSVCLGNSYTLSPGGALSYTIQGGSTVVSPTTSSTYTISGADAIGCKNNITASLTVLSLPTLTLSTANPSICVGEEVVLSASGAFTYTWGPNSTGSSVSVTPLSSTVYTVKGTDANGCSSIAIILQNVNLCTGLEKSDLKFQSLKFYPNPTKDLLMIMADGVSGNTHLTIYNALGQKVYNDLIQQNSFTLDLTDYPNGVYTFHVTENSRSVQYFKVIKN